MVFWGSIRTCIQRNKGANTHNNIQTVIFTGVLRFNSNIQINCQTNTQWQCLTNPELPHYIQKGRFGRNILNAS